MLSHLEKRITAYVFSFAAVLNLVFLLPRLAKGGALESLAGVSRLPGVEVAQVISRLGLDHPMYYQYALFLKNVFLTFPPYLGVSYGYYPYQVSSIFLIRSEWSLVLLLPGLVFGILITYGLARAASHSKWLEGALTHSLFVYNALPLFWVSMMLLLPLAKDFHMIPTFGNVSPGLSPTQPEYYLSILWHMALPVAVLSSATASFGFFILRQPVKYDLNADYIRNARSRGFDDRYIGIHYRFIEFLSSALSYGYLWTAFILGGLVLVEPVFAWPGVGDLLVDAIIGRDYPLMFGFLFFSSLIVIAVGFASDILQSSLDPRLSFKEAPERTRPLAKI